MRIACRVEKTADQIIPTSLATAIVFDDIGTRVVYDFGGFRRNVITDSTVLTVPISGIYHVDGSIVYLANSVGSRALWFGITDVTRALVTYQVGRVRFQAIDMANAPGGAATHLVNSADIMLQAGDMVALWTYQDSGIPLGSVGLANFTNRWCSLNIHLVSAEAAVYVPDVPLISGIEVLAFVGNTAPSQYDIEWADTVANAIEAGINTRLNGGLLTNAAFAELKTSALIAGAEGYKRREATFGITGYADMEGNAIRVAKDYLEGIKPMIDRYSAGPGIG